MAGCNQSISLVHIGGSSRSSEAQTRSLNVIGVKENIFLIWTYKNHLWCTLQGVCKYAKRLQPTQSCNAIVGSDVGDARNSRPRLTEPPVTRLTRCTAPSPPPPLSAIGTMIHPDKFASLHTYIGCCLGPGEYKAHKQINNGRGVTMKLT